MANTPVIELSREALVEELMWNEGGNGFGICEVGNQLRWALERPGPDKPDLKSIVLVNVPAEKYTDTQLRWLVLFSRHVTAKHDEVCKRRMGANLIVIGKEQEDRWLRKQLTWTMGPMYSKTMLSAMGVFLKTNKN